MECWRRLQGAMITRISIILDMPRNFCLCHDRYRKCIGTWTIQSCEREYASSSVGFCTNSFLRLVQKEYRTCINARVTVTTVEQLLPLNLALRKNTGKLREQISATMDSKIGVHLVVVCALSRYDIKFQDNILTKCTK